MFHLLAGIGLHASLPVRIISHSFSTFLASPGPRKPIPTIAIGAQESIAIFASSSSEWVAFRGLALVCGDIAAFGLLDFGQ